MGSQIRHGKSARMKGLARKRRRKRAERRAATADVREKVNARRLAEGHPGWVENPPKEDPKFLRWLEQFQA